MNRSILIAFFPSNLFGRQCIVLNVGGGGVLVQEQSWYEWDGANERSWSDDMQFTASCTAAHGHTSWSQNDLQKI